MNNITNLTADQIQKKINEGQPLAWLIVQANGKYNMLMTDHALIGFWQETKHEVVPLVADQSKLINALKEQLEAANNLAVKQHNQIIELIAKQTTPPFITLDSGVDHGNGLIVLGESA